MRSTHLACEVVDHVRGDVSHQPSNVVDLGQVSLMPDLRAVDDRPRHRVDIDALLEQTPAQLMPDESRPSRDEGAPPIGHPGTTFVDEGEDTSRSAPSSRT